ncbi:MAG: DUF2334 domain-containing protein [Chloroflexi bacterium]|nr:DUF2334 domain-containing protein [Chloroflexota bacterium]
MKFAIRDDDTCYFTRPEQLERVYRAYWDRVPVSLAIVPVHASTRSKGIPEACWDGDDEFPLADNGELVAFLRAACASGRVSPMLHGYSHKNYSAGYEFQAAPDLVGRARRGRGYLEALLGRPIRTFVPPHNALSRSGLAAMDDVGLDVLGVFNSFRPDRKPLSIHAVMNYLTLQRYRRKTGRGRTERLIYPRSLRYKNHAEFGCQLLKPGTTAAELVAAFDEARQFGGDFCLATHYWEIDDRLAGVLRSIVEHAEQAGVDFVAADRLFD